MIGSEVGSAVRRQCSRVLDSFVVICGLRFRGCRSSTLISIKVVAVRQEVLGSLAHSSTFPPFQLKALVGEHTSRALS